VAAVDALGIFEKDDLLAVTAMKNSHGLDHPWVGEMEVEAEASSAERDAEPLARRWINRRWLNRC